MTLRRDTGYMSSGRPPRLELFTPRDFVPKTFDPMASAVIDRFQTPKNRAFRDVNRVLKVVVPGHKSSSSSLELFHPLTKLADVRYIVSSTVPCRCCFS